MQRHVIEPAAPEVPVTTSAEPSLREKNIEKFRPIINDYHEKNKSTTLVTIEEHYQILADVQEIKTADTVTTIVYDEKSRESVNRILDKFSYGSARWTPDIEIRKISTSDCINAITTIPTPYAPPAKDDPFRCASYRDPMADRRYAMLTLALRLMHGVIHHANALLAFQLLKLHLGTPILLSDVNLFQAQMLRYGHGVDVVDKYAAIKVLQTAPLPSGFSSEPACVACHFALIDMQQAEPIKDDNVRWARVIDFYHHYAKQGNIFAFFELARIVDKFRPEDRDVVLTLLKNAADGGLTYAKTVLDYMLRDRINRIAYAPLPCPLDYVKAVKSYIESNTSDSLCAAGQLYKTGGNGLTASPEKAVEYFRKAAAMAAVRNDQSPERYELIDQSAGIDELIKCYRDGFGVAPNRFVVSRLSTIKKLDAAEKIAKHKMALVYWVTAEEKGDSRPSESDKTSIDALAAEQDDPNVAAKLRELAEWFSSPEGQGDDSTIGVMLMLCWKWPAPIPRTIPVAAKSATATAQLGTMPAPRAATPATIEVAPTPILGS